MGHDGARKNLGRHSSFIPRHRTDGAAPGGRRRRRWEEFVGTIRV
jgi:hypothetical protein